jgi:peptide/nickel transport system ATP-binding protein
MSVVDVSKVYRPRRGITGASLAIHALRGVDLDIYAGETVALVGESGSGKSTIGKMLVGLEDPTDGRVLFNGVDLADLKGAARLAYRRSIQMVFQNPMASLNPRHRLGKILSQTFLTHRICSRDEAMVRAGELLELVGLSPAATYLKRYPHQLSGGQRQRVGIARAISLSPQMIVADEPIAALDTSVRAEILKLMKEIAATTKISYLFITHDLNAARVMADRVVVLYLGRVVETGPAAQVLNDPQHPYTKALLSAVPRVTRGVDGYRPVVLRGEIPSASAEFEGCSFQTRCPYVQPDRCLTESPELRLSDSGQDVACHFTSDIAAGRAVPQPELLK